MKKFVLMLLFGLASGGAFAEDFKQPVPFDWTGAYVGGQVGYARGDSTGGAYPLAAGVPGIGSIDPDGFIGGIHAGFNHQFSNSVVFGLEGEINHSNIDGASALYQGGILLPNNSATAKMSWNGAVRARAGYAIDRFLPYIAGGVSFGRYEFTPDYGATQAIPDSKMHTGWNIGAGVEYAVTEKLTTRIEFRTTDYGKATYEIPGFPAYESRVNLKTHDIRIGLSYKF